MKIFKILTEEEEFEEFKQKQFDDDKVILDFLNKCDHKTFLRTIIKIGTFLDVATTYFEFSQKYIEGSMHKDESLIKRTLNKVLSELSEKICYEYDLDPETEVIEDAVFYDGEIYILFSKKNFLKALGIL